MANIKGQGRPTIYTKANKGDIYTDTNTGIKYECLGPDGFVEAGDIEKNKYDWKEIKTSGGVSSWNDLTDKPFEEMVERTTIWENKEISFRLSQKVDGSFYGLAGFSDTMGYALETGAKYIVVYDGAEYECIAGDWGHLGDFDLANFPFSIALDMGLTLYADAAGTHTFSIYAVKETVKTIDTKFLPEHLQFGDNNKKMTQCENQLFEITEHSTPDGSEYYATFNTAGNFGAWVGDGMDAEYFWNLRDGDRVLVVLDNVEYEEVIRVYDSVSKYYVGNQEYTNFDNGREFNIAFNNSVVEFYMPAEQVGTAHEVSIYAFVEDIKTINEKFIPDTIARKSDVSGGKELVVTVTDSYYGTDTWNAVGAETNMSWADAKAAVLDGSLTKVVVLEHLGDEYEARISNATIRSASLDDGMNFSLCIDYMVVKHNGAATITVNTRSIIWKESGDMSGKEKQIIA